MPVIDYEHEYPQDIRDAYTRLRPSFDETFSPRLAMGLNVGAQLHYQKSAFPEEFAKVATILTYAQYWTARLTGVAANELTSLGCHTDLWNPKAGRYSSLVDRLAIRDLMLLQIFAAWPAPASPQWMIFFPIASRIGFALAKASSVPPAMKVIADAETKKILGAAILGIEGDEVIHGIIDAMNAGTTYPALQWSVPIHPTVSELIPTLLGDLKPV